MSLFYRKPYKPIEKDLETPFKIHHFVRLDGVKQDRKERYRPTEFISPIFGMDVKDETVAPFVNKDTGDIAKRYDAFRDNPLEDRSTYREFKGTMVNTEVRKELFGDDIYTNPNRKIEQQKTKEPEIDIPYMGRKEAPRFDEVFIPKEQTLPVEPTVEEKPTLESHFDEPVVVDLPLEQPIDKPKPVEITKMDPVAQDEIRPHVEEAPVLRPEIQPVEKEVPVIKEVPKPKKKIRRQYRFPTHEMFSKQDRDQNARPEWLLKQEQAINDTLNQFGVPGVVKNIIKGPTVTRHEIELEPGVNVRMVSNIKDNLMMNLAAKSLRIEAPIPGKAYVGLELPNGVPEVVAFGNVVADPTFSEDKNHPLKIALGVDIDGNNVFADIQKMPHGLIAGATASGKSVCVNTIIMSLIMKNHPDDLKMILIDPKLVELIHYSDIPHLATPVITDPKMAATALAWAVQEMDRRFRVFMESRTRDLESYNEKAETDDDLQKMPYIIIIIDELADLMMVSASDVEDAIQRITQKARAAGIHLLVATQRPTTDVVKGTIKANIPTRIAFRVSSYVDSTTIIDGAGAEQLLGRGDMLLKTTDRPMRLQGAYIKDSEIHAVVDFIKDQVEPDYMIDHESLVDFSQKVATIESDDLFVNVALYVVTEQNASINNLQKTFGIGFNRAQAMVNELERIGVVSSGSGTKAKEVLVTEYELRKLLGLQE